MQLWPLAMVIAQSIGGDTLRATMSEMLEGGLQRGSLLHTFGLLATSSHDRVAASLKGPSAPTPSLGSATADGEAASGFKPCQPDTWPRKLLMLAGNRTTGDDIALCGLGDHLWSLDRPHARTYAHVCYILAGRHVDFAANEASKFAAPGLDAYAGEVGSTDALQRTELLAWLMSQRQGMPMYWLAPHYLQVGSLF